MARRNFFDILTDSTINLTAEYNRIYSLFYEGDTTGYVIVDIVDDNFQLLPTFLKGRSISLSDFDKTHQFIFFKNPGEISSDELISFCEYVFNLSDCTLKYAQQSIRYSEYEAIRFFLRVVFECMETLGLKQIKKENITIFVPKKPDVVAASEITNKDVAVNLLEYHHHSLKGNLSKKKLILKLMADDIESDRAKLRNVNKTLESQLFQMMNKFIRHDQAKTPYISTLEPKELEQCYDDIFQMWLLAKLEIDHYEERSNRITLLLGKMNG